MTDAAFGVLTLTGTRLHFVGGDPAFAWITAGSDEASSSPALGFNLASKSVTIGPGWTLSAMGALAIQDSRTDLLGVDGVGNHWIRVGPNEPQDAALGFNAGARVLLINTGWTTQLGGGLKFPDGTVQTTATARGPAGPAGQQGLQGVPGPPGLSLPKQIVAATDENGAGALRVLGKNGGSAVAIGADANAADNGVIGVTSLNSAILKAEMYIDANGRGAIAAEVKNFRVAHPSRPDSDIVYTCIEGPEAAAYTRGTAALVAGRATVRLPEHFSSVVGSGLTVIVTPLSATSLGLAVTKKTLHEFVVEELHGGAGSYEFDWEVKGVRAGHEAYQVVQPRRTAS